MQGLAACYSSQTNPSYQILYLSTLKMQKKMKEYDPNKYMIYA